MPTYGATDPNPVPVPPPAPKPPTVSSIQWIVYTFLCPVFDSSSCTTIL